MHRLFPASFLASLCCIAFAQGSISGTFAAPSAADYVLIACFPDEDDGCSSTLSGVTDVRTSGGPSEFSIDGLAAGDYLLLAWLDSNANGEVEERELELLLGADGQPVLVSPPASGIEFRLAGAPTVDGPAAAPAQPIEGALARLVGIWQETRASSGDYRNTLTGYEFTATSGFSTQLVIGADASYYMAYYSSGYQTNCSLQVTYFERSRGTAAVSGTRLVLKPSEHRLDVGGCTNPGSFDLGTADIVYELTYAEGFDFEGLRSYDLTLTGGPHPLDLELLHHEPLMPGFQPAQPQDFVVGDVAVFSEFVGLWAPEASSDVGFYDPGTGAFYLPEYNGSPHEWLRFDEATYALAHAWRDYNVEGVCSKDYVYYESGLPTFSITRPAEYAGGNTIGHARFQARTARLIVNIHDCDEYSQVLRYELVPQTSYYQWLYRPETNDYVHIPEGLELSCPWQKSEWQFMVCSGWDSASYLRR